MLITIIQYKNQLFEIKRVTKLKLIIIEQLNWSNYFESGNNKNLCEFEEIK